MLYQRKLQVEIPIRISTPKWTFLVVCNSNGIITAAAPVAKTFLSQPLSNLLTFLRKHHKTAQVTTLK